MNIVIYFIFKLSFRDKYLILLLYLVSIQELCAAATHILGQTNGESENTDWQRTFWQSVTQRKCK